MLDTICVQFCQELHFARQVWHLRHKCLKPSSGLLEPAHSNSASPTQSRFSADTMQCDPCEPARAKPLSDAASTGATRGTLLEPAHTKSFSSYTREGAQEGLSSGPLAQTRHRQRDAGFAADMRCYAIRASPLAQTPSHTRWLQVPERDFARARSHKALYVQAP